MRGGYEGIEGEYQCALTSVQYTLKKFIPIYFYFITALILTYVENVIIHIKNEGLSGRFLLTQGCDFLKESLLLYGTGFCKSNMGLGWYVSALFWVLPVIVYLLLRLKGLFGRILCGVVPILYYAHRGVKLRQGGQDDIYRAFCAICLGMFIHSVCSMLRECRKKNTKINHPLFVYCLNICSVVIALVVLYHMNRGKDYQFEGTHTVLTLMIVFLIMLLSYDDRLKWAKYFRLDSLFSFLGKISLPVYLYQFVVGKVVSHMGKTFFWSGTVMQSCYVGMTLLVSVIAVTLYQRVLINHHVSIKARLSRKE